MQFVVREMTKPYRNQHCLVVADSAFESMGIMEWGASDDNKIGFCMTFGGKKICHPVFFSKKSEMYKHFYDNEKRGATLIAHSDTVTFTLFKDSSVMRLVDNDLDYDSLTPRKIRRFYKNRKGAERWKGVCKVSFTIFYMFEFTNLNVFFDITKLRKSTVDCRNIIFIDI